MKTDERHRTIAEILRQQSEASVEQLMQACGASGATIRRDLEVLSGHGVLRRVHGGARSLIGQGQNPGYGQRELEDRDAKTRIGAAVAGLLAEREHVWLDSGSTATEVARAVSGRALTLMPMSLQALNAATAGEGSAGSRPALLLPGGSVVPGELCFRGPLAESNIRSLRFDTAVVTPCAVHPNDGLLAHDLEDAAVKKAGLESAARVVVAASAAKWQAHARVLVAGLDRVDIIVTDRQFSAQDKAELEKYSVEVVSV
ncbi:DeoR/GlpR family DNA-binding transcription regulator [Arthrobacter sp. FW306-05-C]|uniref:DeoR/GlpR family DNA-binding transcription regulator n=1 Tax=unclassified Arthrobacter TaxID=235627 RepID=UPI001EF10E36|nr:MULTISPECIES: DeoR/GlpR family DNA-binding transcription regulator [unclassified Arthrobacter]UKA66850.1 DeoR/GlpR family DNA-binding transcription regulator [Arthrobacter sp. FW306-05-C]UKA75485.1 DeoR/GlpR family DNA-binding transcription regulator [Arthrobacter sp. FW306-07-I]